MRFLVTGATGLIGRAFILKALEQKHEVVALVRNPDAFVMLPPENVFSWHHSIRPPTNALHNVDVIINLAGEGIANGRWTSKRKQSLRNSRIVGTQNIVKALRELPQQERPHTFISGSAIGYYGYVRKDKVTEESAGANDFLAQLCADWEAAALEANELNMRVVLARTAIVLSKEGGALKKMPPVVLGRGRNQMSWVHIDDMVSFLFFAAQLKSIVGPVNVAAPSSICQKEFVRALARAKGLPGFVYAPPQALRLALGEMANALLSDLSVEPKKLLENGFQFRYASLQEALDSLL